jgi:FAS-associated factor 2
MSLSVSQQEALEQLCAVTASDTAAARQRDERILRENGWDVQVSAHSTVTRHFL